MMELSNKVECVKVPLDRLLRCSLEKINVAKHSRNGTNLRKNLMIANIIYKARNYILEHRTKVFIERNHQLYGTKGRAAAEAAEVAVAQIQLFPQEEEHQKQDVFEQRIEMETCVDVEKENNPPPAVAISTAEISTTTAISRKRRSDDVEDPLSRDRKRLTCEGSVSSVSSAICSLTENFHKAISLHLSCSAVGAVSYLQLANCASGAAANSTPIIVLSNIDGHTGQSLLQQLNSIVQQMTAVAAS